MSKKTPAPATAPAPAPSRTPTTLPQDEFHGVGGTYEMVDGVRRPVPPPADAAPPAGEQA